MGELCIQEGIHDLYCQARAYYSSAQSQNISIIMLPGRLCAEAVCTQRCPDSFHLICSNRNADSCSADQNPFLAFAALYSSPYFSGVDGIIYRLGAVASKIFIRNLFFLQIFYNLLFQLITAMVTSQCYHMHPPLFYIQGSCKKSAFSLTVQLYDGLPLSKAGS